MWFSVMVSEEMSGHLCQKLVEMLTNWCETKWSEIREIWYEKEKGIRHLGVFQTQMKWPDKFPRHFHSGWFCRKGRWWCERMSHRIGILFSDILTGGCDEYPFSDHIKDIFYWRIGTCFLPKNPRCHSIFLCWNFLPQNVYMSSWWQHRFPCCWVWGKGFLVY